MGYADLHVHTTFSDGSLTPEGVVARALRNGVTTLAICDHNVIEGALAAEPLALQAGIRFIRGVEIDSIHEGRDVHLLAYNADWESEAFRAMLSHQRYALDHMSNVLLERMKTDYGQLDMREFQEFHYDPSGGGWKMLSYLMDKCITSSLREGMGMYPRYGVTYAAAGFWSAREIIGNVHAAGGKVILAHPGEVFPREPMAVFEQLTESVIDLGADGIECHYPTHSPEQTACLLSICARRNLKITSGSDFHGLFGNTDIGLLKTDESQIGL